MYYLHRRGRCQIFKMDNNDALSHCFGTIYEIHEIVGYFTELLACCWFQMKARGLTDPPRRRLEAQAWFEITSVTSLYRCKHPLNFVIRH